MAPDPTARKTPFKVAVLGGGCAAMAAAFELSRPEQRGRFEITVYQMGWRLGGKGASGRGRHDRIEEHGLHLWMGFYENAFRLMRECYAELGRDPARCRIADWRDAFSPAEVNVVADRSPGGRWTPWKVLFPPMPGHPGDPPEDSRPWTVGSYLSRCVSLLRTLIESLPAVVLEGSGSPQQGPATHAAPIADRIAQLMKYGELASLAALVEALRLLEGALGALPTPSEAMLTRLVTAIGDAAHRRIEVLIEGDDQARRLWEIADLVLAVLRGAIRDRLLTHPDGFDCINGYDCREWLLRNGASKRSVNSAFVRALYDLAFAYEDGDVTRPRIAAGQALRGAVRAFFTYREAFFWRMQAGMGDVVFAPLYEVLRRRGVRFEFFHRLENLRLSPPGQPPYVAAIDLDVQATPRDGEYRPLIDVRDLPCWPAQPLFDQLSEGRTLQREGWDLECPWDRRCVGSKTLEVGRDFDFVVLGVGVGAVPAVARELIERDGRWRAMVRHVKSVPTQAFQVWLGEDMAALGWPHGAANLSGFVEPFDTWADMRHLIPEESFLRSPKGIAYFCSVLADTPGSGLAHARARSDEVRRNAIAFLNDHVPQIWPAAEQRRGGFRWDVLVCDREPGGSARAVTGERRFDAQYWRANVNPSDRYVLALPGTLRYRISPLDRTFDNLTIAGDWTDCGFNEGCVEAAVMSGRLAAHALSQTPPLADIVGYDHP